MALILLLETATTVCSVALARDGKLLAMRELNSKNTHAENITIFIQEVCKEANVQLKELDAVAVSEGPGSYTGLRIGASTAKGLCYALEKPLIGIRTLKALANICLSQPQTSDLKPQTIFLPMIDARRMEVYCAVFDSSLKEISPAEAVIVNENSFAEVLKTNRVIFCGDGAPKCKSLFEKNANAVFAEVNLSATGMISLAEEKFSGKEFEDVSLFEPFYLKEAAVGSEGK